MIDARWVRIVGRPWAVALALVTTSACDGGPEPRAAAPEVVEAPPDEAPPDEAPPVPPAAAPGLVLGARMPELILSSLDGSTARIGANGGRPTVVSFFATGCEPCREEFPLLSRLAGEHAGLRVVGVSVDEGPVAPVAEFARAHGLSYTVLHDPRGRVSARFGVPPIPAAFVFDADAQLVYQRVGGGAELLSELPAAVRAALPPAR